MPPSDVAERRKPPEPFVTPRLLRTRNRPATHGDHNYRRSSTPTHPSSRRSRDSSRASSPLPTHRALPTLPVHVVQTPAVRRERPHRRRPIRRPKLRLPQPLGSSRRLRPISSAPAVASRRARTRRVLPLRLARQPVRLGPRHANDSHATYATGVLPRNVRITGRPPRPQPHASPGRRWPVACTKRSYSSNVTSYTPSANDAELHLVHRHVGESSTVPARHAAHPESAPPAPPPARDTSSTVAELPPRRTCRSAAGGG